MKLSYFLFAFCTEDLSFIESLILPNILYFDSIVLNYWIKAIVSLSAKINCFYYIKIIC